MFYFEPNFIEKFFLEGGFSNFDQNRNDGNKNWLFGRHFETVLHFQFFFSELWFFIVHTCMVQNFIAKFRWESGFLKGGSILGTNGSKSTLVT